jgi:hypothetical protein
LSAKQLLLHANVFKVEGSILFQGLGLVFQEPSGIVFWVVLGLWTLDGARVDSDLVDGDWACLKLFINFVSLKEEFVVHFGQLRLFDRKLFQLVANFSFELFDVDLSGVVNVLRK